MEQDSGTRVPPGGSVTAVVTRDVGPGRERDYEEWAHRVVSATARYGATGHTILTPDAGAPTRRVLIVQFADEEGLRAWDQSEERNRLVREAGEFSLAYTSSVPLAWRPGSPCLVSGPSFHRRAGSNSWLR